MKVGAQVIAYQMRDFGDVLFPSILQFFGITGRFWFALSAKSNDIPSESDSLEGTIYIYKSKADWRQGGENEIRHRIKAINETSRSTLPPERDTEIAYHFATAMLGLARTADIQVKFILYRTGEAYFSAPTFRDENLAVASSEYATSLGHDFTKWMADQSYFFLRDIAHRHKHHEPGDDTILILQTRGDEFSWRRKILYSLHYQVIRAKRFSNPQSLTQSMGLLAYANSFQRICEKKLPTTDSSTDDQIPWFNSDEILLSLKAQIKQNDILQAEHSVAATKQLTKATNIRTLALTSVGIVLAVMLTFIQPRIADRGTATLAAITDIVAANFGAMVLTVVLFLFIVWTSTADFFYAWKRDLLELANVRRGKSIFLLTLAGILSFLFAIIFGSPAILSMTKPFIDILETISLY